MGYYNGGVRLSVRQAEMREKNAAWRKQRMSEGGRKGQITVTIRRYGDGFLRDAEKIDKKVIRFSADKQQQRQAFANMPQHKPIKRYLKKAS